MAAEPTGRLPVGFRRLIAGWAASLSGDGLRVVALPLLAAQIDPTPVRVAAVAVAGSLPWLLVAVPAGALVDRLDPARVVARAHLVRALLTGGLVLALLTIGIGIPALCLIAFGITTAETFADSAAQSLLIATVPHHQWEQANSRFVTVETLALDLVGPLAAGILFVVRPWLPFAVSAGLFVIGAVLVAGIRVPATADPVGSTVASGADRDVVGSGDDQPRTVGDQATDDGSTWRRIREGLAQLWTDPLLRTLVITVAIMAAANAAMDGVLVLYATGTLGLPATLFPTLLAAYSLGTLLAAVLVGRWGRRVPGGRLMIGALAGIGATMLVMGLAPVPAVAWSCFAVMGVAGGTWNILSATRRQRRTPRDMVARVSSAFRVIAWGTIPIGAAAGGLVGSSAGIPAVLAIAGGVVLLLGVFVARSFWATDLTPTGGRHRSPAR